MTEGFWTRFRQGSRRLRRPSIGWIVARSCRRMNPNCESLDFTNQKETCQRVRVESRHLRRLCGWRGPRVPAYASHVWHPLARIVPRKSNGIGAARVVLVSRPMRNHPKFAAFHSRARISNHATRSDTSGVSPHAMST
eukprot:scaffold2288_cov258-Pinguiococcus_pyrenoidosus.AAC.8